MCPWRWGWTSKSPDKSATQGFECQQTIGAASRGAFELLLQAARRPSQTLHGRNRQGRNHANLFGNAVLRNSAHYQGASPPWVSRQSQTRAASAPGNRAADRLSTASFQHVGTSSRTRKISVPSEKSEDRPSEPGLGDGHHLHGCLRAQGVRDRHRGPLQPQEHGVQRREHDGHAPLRRDAPARGEQIRRAGDIQFGSGKPVHQPGVHGRTEEARNRHQHGRTRPVPRQCQDGTLLVGAEIRGHQAQGLRFPASTPQRRPKLRELL